MRALLWGGLAAVLSAGAAPASAADIPGNTSTKAVITPGPEDFLGRFERKADTDWYRVTLKGGRNYAFQVGSYCDTRVRLRNAAGKVLRSSGLASDDEDTGFEFRSATTKTYFVEYLDADPASCLEFGGSYPRSFSSHVATEVRGDTTTRATIATGQTIAGLLNWSWDKDFFRATLDAGKGYTVVVDPRPLGTTLAVVDSEGKVVAGGGYAREPLRFEVPRSGTYYVVVGGDGYRGPYKVGLSTP